ncbi:MAG: carboxypeptidase-like regulatory domain-containing protein, partial [Bacteroidetes bacterium]|nr:carboxypeptidase-like regulatory domain-containing protein [Bacteroidota bacterium]
EAGDLHITVDKRYEHDLLFEPGNVYYINQQEVRSFPITKYPDDLLLYDNRLPYGMKYNLTSFDQLYYHPVELEKDTAGKNQPIAAPTEIKKKREKPFINYRNYSPPKHFAAKGNGGTLQIMQHHGYISYSQVWLISKKDDSLSMIQNNASTLHYSDSGIYDLLMMNDTAICIYKNIWLPPAATLYLFSFQHDIHELNTDEVYDYQSLVKRLTKIPLRPFTDTPVVIKPVVLYKHNNHSKYCKIKGAVVDALYQTPLDYANIIAEIDGIYKCGAVTNEDGDFEMNNIPAGKYMLKIRVPGYRYQIIYDLMIEKGIDIIIKIKLFHSEDIITVDAEGNVGYGMAGMEDAPQLNILSQSNNINVAGGRSSGSINIVESYRVGGQPTYALNTMEYQANVSYMQLLSVTPGLAKNKADAIIPPTPFGKTEEEMMQQRLDVLANDAAANRKRTDFRDYGYWVPNLITDKKGMAYATIQFPDNLTSWKTMIPAMNGRRQSGLFTIVTKSYKPLTSSMAIPNYLIAGDRLVLKGKVLNYTGNRQRFHWQFDIDQQLRKAYDTAAAQVLIDTIIVHAPLKADSMTASVLLAMNNGYIDGEERPIAVKPNGILISSCAYHHLITDTTLYYVVPADVTKATVE